MLIAAALRRRASKLGRYVRITTAAGTVPSHCSRNWILDVSSALTVLADTVFRKHWRAEELNLGKLPSGSEASIPWQKMNELSRFLAPPQYGVPAVSRSSIKYAPPCLPTVNGYSADTRRPPSGEPYGTIV